MMQIVYFSQKEQFLTEMATSGEKIVYITPSPAKADGLRTRLKGQASGDVITIAKFTSELLTSLWTLEALPAVKRKSELLLIFGILKNKYLPELGYEQFTQAYNLFSDLRSFTLNEDALSSVLDEQPEAIKASVELFWKLLEITGYLDEHGAYQRIAEKLRSSEELDLLKKTYVFWGFQHLNGQQVDLLKALSIRYPVVVPFPLSLKDKIKKSDWISWIRESRVQERDLPLIPQDPKGFLLPVNSREISARLKGFLNTRDQIVLGVSKLSPLHIDIAPSREVRFKISYQLVAPELREVSHDVKEFRGTHLELRTFIQEKLKNASSLKHFRAQQLYLEALDSIQEMTDEVIQVDHFFLKLLFEVTSLNQPRTSFVPASEKDMTIDLKDMSSLEDIDRGRRVILCVDERFDEIQSLGQNYTETIQKALASLGPLKRNELELLFKHWEFRDLFSTAEVFVLMNEGTLKHSLIWKRLFQDIVLETLAEGKKTVERPVRDHFRSLEKSPFQGSFSASKIQTYMDCPRKFYYSYVEKVFPTVVLEKDFDPMTSGTIIHEIIEGYFKRKLTEGDLAPLTREIMQAHIKKNKLSLPNEVYLQREMIFNHRSLNGIRFIRNLEEKLGERVQWRIEEPFDYTEDYPIKGRIDCLGVGEKYVFLLDFKSTEGAASSAQDVATYESVQLWTYAHASKKLLPDFDEKAIVLGYVVLEDPSDSVLLTDDEELYQKNKEEKFCRVHRFKDPFKEKLKESHSAMVETVHALSSERDFPPRPREKKSCLFCELNKVCVKSELSHV